MTNIRTKPKKQTQAKQTQAKQTQEKQTQEKQTQAKKRCVISTGAADGLIVRCAVERPPHFAFVFAGSLCCVAQTVLELT
jgi:hypothetical protein